jgi:hypothetical protein
MTTRLTTRGTTRLTTRGTTPGPSLNPTALAWQEARGITSAQTKRLSGFLNEIEDELVTPVELILGRSEWASRVSTTHYVPFGNNGTITNTVGNNTNGIGFDGGTGRFQFANPLKSAAVSNMFMMASARVATLPGAAAAIVSGYGSGTRGPQILANVSGSGAQVRGSFSTTSSGGPIGQNARYGVMRANKSFLAGFSFRADGHTADYGLSSTALSVSGLDFGSPGSSALTLYNDGTNWELGARVDNSLKFAGEVEFAIICAHAVSLIQQATIINAGRKYDIFGDQERIIVGVGDSMTVGDDSVSPTVSRTPQLAFLQDSAWRNGTLYSNSATGGVGFNGTGGQYELWLRIKPALAKLTAFDRYVMLWAGYNTGSELNPNNAASSVPAEREALADQYINLGLEAAAMGVQTIHWSALTSGTVDPDSATHINTGLFNDYYKARCIEEGFIFYDHRVTFDDNQFDTSDRNQADYFVGSTVHLSELGQATLVADFIAQNPTPINPFALP